MKRLIASWSIAILLFFLAVFAVEKLNAADYKILVKVPHQAAADSARADSIWIAVEGLSLAHHEGRLGEVRSSNSAFTSRGYVARLPQDSLFARDTLVLQALKSIKYFSNMEVIITELEEWN